MMDETRARFLAAIASQLPVERVAEVHLFPAIRQGGMESGVAVLALDLATAPVLVTDAPAADVRDASADSSREEREVVELADAADGGDGPYRAESVDEDDAREALDAQDGDAHSEEAQGLDEPLRGEGSRSAEGSGGPEGSEEPTSSEEPAPRAAPRRFTVYTARYRHTLKGPDRGKWEVSVTEEADAPLLTVDAVVRGVQRRSGDVDEIVRLSGDEMRAAT
jgi:acetaldehyde dehydrogenase (acetylating)